MAWVVVNSCNYDGVDICGPFVSEDDARKFEDESGGRTRAVVCVADDSGRFVAIEACVLGGITVYGWFPTRQAAEAFCHRQAMMSPPGVQFAAAAVS